MNAVERMVDAGTAVLVLYREYGRDWLGFTLSVILGKSPLALNRLPPDDPEAPHLIFETIMSSLPDAVRASWQTNNQEVIETLPPEVTPELVARVGDKLILQHGSKWCAATHPKKWQRLLARLGRDSRAWGTGAKNVVKHGEALALAVKELFQKPLPLGHPPEQVQQALAPLKKALDSLSVYAMPHGPIESVSPVTARRGAGRPPQHEELGSELLKGYQNAKKNNPRLRLDSYLATRPEVVGLRSEGEKKAKIKKMRTIYQSRRSRVARKNRDLRKPRER